MKVCVLVSIVWLAAGGPALGQTQVKDRGSISIGSQSFAVLNFSNPNTRNTSFNQDIKVNKATGEIVTCDVLVDVPVGTADGNNSYGGYCSLSNRGQTQKVKICNDDMVGHFKLEPAGSNPPTRDELANFVAENCFGG